MCSESECVYVQVRWRWSCVEARAWKRKAPYRNTGQNRARQTDAAAITDARARIDAASNGFAEEFMRAAGNLTNSSNSPRIDDDECNFPSLRQVHRTRDVGRWRRPVFNATRVR